MSEAGVVSQGHTVVAKASDMISKYVGGTPPKVQEHCQRAKGGVLFVDECYTFIQPGQVYGSEAVDELLQHMENDRGEFVVIFAGYPKHMSAFLNSNRGLPSRVPYVFACFYGK